MRWWITNFRATKFKGSSAVSVLRNNSFSRCARAAALSSAAIFARSVKWSTAWGPTWSPFTTAMAARCAMWRKPQALLRVLVLLQNSVFRRPQVQAGGRVLRVHGSALLEHLFVPHSGMRSSAPFTLSAANVLIRKHEVPSLQKIDAGQGIGGGKNWLCEKTVGL